MSDAQVASSYDYIIVGAGSAGCVLADRLSRDPTKRVLLLEAGGRNEELMVRMPRGMVKIWTKPKWYWPFPADAQEGRPAGETWYYGKGLGGSSAVNGTWYFRGQPRDYDAWEEQGNRGWNWAAIEEAYGELEDYRGRGNYGARGQGGPMQVTQVRGDGELTEAIFEAARQNQIPFHEDVNTPGTQVAGPTQQTVDDRGKRVTAWTAFLRDAGRRSNLTVLTEALVHRVTFADKVATGVEVTQGGRTRIIAGKRVVLAAGVLQSPKLLQLSGIGPADVLAKHGVDLVHENAAVGRNMNEHMMFAISWRLKNAKGLNHEFRGWRPYWHGIKYILTGKGLMASLLPEVSIMASLEAGSDWPDLQIGISPYSMASSAEDKPEAGRGQTEAVPGITATAFCLRPGSHGFVEMASKDPAAPPRLAPCWFSDPADRTTILAAMRRVRAIMHAPALAPYLGEETVPGPEVQSDDQILAAADWMISTGLHGTGTCRMGPSQDSGPGAVVDPQLKVHGVDGLYVADCSAMPTPISGNTNGPAMAFAWLAAGVIARS
ncbi:GMC family oxidoreductase N-terminal domain-containing protein [Novosphingobium profundi]|uniref:GMC family oxidoreductase n=1 Tax=Novosphingobium profundi TaxID=1774954 RepID=UPI001BDB6977|nr:GMC family oxidoreductase N-terminal domain-containing protein [Novosphingobium profundi]MBT0671511.1 GMC family oxidoreductase N-terminal domain-containing protein [Novosphingobium profundi]